MKIPAFETIKFCKSDEPATETDRLVLFIAQNSEPANYDLGKFEYV